MPPGECENEDDNGNEDGNYDGNDEDKDDNDACRPGETVELPCDASDADKFVRVWMKVRFLLNNAEYNRNTDFHTIW